MKIFKMEEELKCPLCLDFFKSPVLMTSCGHNYCQVCLTGMVGVPWLCPECRTDQQQRPEQLARNFFLERTANKFIESRKNICETHGSPKKLRKYLNRITDFVDKLFLGCLKHDRSLCFECVHVGMCDGQAADNCDVMSLAEFETTLNNRLAKLDDQFSAISDVLKGKKQAFAEMYRKDPRISHDEEVSCLLLTNETFDPVNLSND